MSINLGRRRAVLHSGAAGSDQRRQDGYTLVELLIYSSLLLLVLTIVGGMLMNTLTYLRIGPMT